MKLSFKILFWIFIIIALSCVHWYFCQTEKNLKVYEIDLNKIMMIESSGIPFVVGKAGEIGLFQISPIVLKEYNQLTKNNIKKHQLFNPHINREVAVWYLSERIPQMLKAYNKPITTETIIISFNAGISYLVHGKPIPQITKDYIKKYKRL